MSNINFALKHNADDFALRGNARSSSGDMPSPIMEEKLLLAGYLFEIKVNPDRLDYFVRLSKMAVKENGR